MCKECVLSIKHFTTMPTLTSGMNILMLQMRKLRSEMLDGLPKATQISDVAERKTTILWTPRSVSLLQPQKENSEDDIANQGFGSFFGFFSDTVKSALKIKWGGTGKASILQNWRMDSAHGLLKPMTLSLNWMNWKALPLPCFLLPPLPKPKPPCQEKKSAYSWCLNTHPKIEISSRCSFHKEHLPKARLTRVAAIAFGCGLLQSQSWSPFSSNTASRTSSPDLPGTTQDKGMGSLKMECRGSNSSHQETHTPRSRE